MHTHVKLSVTDRKYYSDLYQHTYLTKHPNFHSNFHPARQKTWQIKNRATVLRLPLWKIKERTSKKSKGPHGQTTPVREWLQRGLNNIEMVPLKKSKPPNKSKSTEAVQSTPSREYKTPGNAWRWSYHSRYLIIPCIGNARIWFLTIGLELSKKEKLRQ